MHGAPFADRGGGGSWPRAVAELKRERKQILSSVECGFSALGRDSGLTSYEMRLVVCPGVGVARDEAGETCFFA